MWATLSSVFLFCPQVSIMLLDALSNRARYHSLHPGFEAAFEFLSRAPLASMAAGRHEIDGQRLFVMLNVGQALGRDGSKAEAHKSYIDIQLTIAGAEVIGWSPLADCREILAPYDAEKDFWLFSEHPKVWCPVPPGVFAIFFPEDVHSPMAAAPETALRKAVVKVAVDWH